MNLKIILLLLFFCVPDNRKAISNGAEDLILGKWISLQKNVVVQVYKENEEFKAKVCWFSDADNPAKPMAIRTDRQNPDVNLRSRKILGMDILKRLTYNPKSKRWEGGIIYDPLSGREWSSVVYFNNKGLLEVKGFWHFEFISKTMTFKRI